MANDKMYKRSLKVYIDGTEVENSVNGINREIRKLKGEMRNLTIGTEEYERKARQLRELDGILQRHRRNIRGVGEEYTSLSARLGKLADGFNRYMGLAAGAVGAVTGLTMTVRKTVEDYAKMQEAESQVRKYTGMTADEVHRLNEEFKKMDTRTSREELNALAGDAGRLGITSREAILEFVDGADKIKVALGDDLGENAVRDIGKLAQMFGEDKKKGLRGAMLATGSAVNELAQNSSASAGAIVEFTARLAGVAQQAGMTQAQIMGIGSVMAQNMQEIPTSATVISQLITKMMQDTGRFAKLAGKDVSEFSKLLRTDANAALVQFLQAMKSRGGFADMAKMFDDMKMDGTRSVGVLSALAGHLDQLAEAQDLANKSYEEGVSVLNEYNVQNTTVQAELDKAKKRFADLSIELGQKLLPIAKYGITTGSTIIKLLSSLINFSIKYAGTIVSLTTTIIGLVAWKNKDVIATKLMNLRNVTLMGNMKKLWAVIAANPWGALAIAVGEVVGVLIDLKRHMSDVAKAEKDLSDIRKQATDKIADQRTKIDNLVAAAKNEKLSLDERKRAINELNRIIPEYNAHLDETTGKYIANKAKLDDYLKSLARQYEIEGAKDLLRDLGKEEAEANTALNKAQHILDESKKAAGTAYTTSFGMVGNTANDAVKMAEDRLKQAEARVKQVEFRRKNIENVYGLDIQKSEIANAPTPESPESPETPEPPVIPTTKNTEKITNDAKELREALARIEAEYTEKQNTLRKQYISGELQDRNTLNEEIEKLELAKLNAMLGVANLEPKKRAEISEKIMNIEMNLRDKVESLMQSLGTTDEQQMQDELNSLQKKFDQEQSVIKQAYERELMKKEEYQEADRKLTEKYDEESRKVRESYAEKQLATLEAFHERELLTLEERRVREMMSEEQYQQELYELRKTWLEKELEQLNLSEEKRTELLNELRRLRIEQEDEQNKREVANLKDKYSDMQNAAQSFGQAFGSTMEEIFAGEEDAFKHFFQNMIKQVLDFLEKMLIAKTAQRTIDSIGSMGIAGIAKAAAEIALITAAFETAKAAIGSFDIGGFTGNGEWNEPRGIVHAGEFVANRHAVRNPSVLPVLSVIDQAQRTGTIANLTASDIAAVLPTRTTVSPIVPMVTGNDQRFDNQELVAMLATVNRTMSAVITRFKDPIRAETYATGKHGTIEAEGLVQRMRNNVTRQKH